MIPKYALHIVVEHGHLASKKTRKPGFGTKTKKTLLSMRLPRPKTSENMYRKHSVKERPTCFIPAV